MSKSSVDYAELAGLVIALATAKAENAPEQVISWIKSRIDFLKAK
jgi:hypothetical protein